MPTIPFAVQVPSLVNLRKRLRAERGGDLDALPVEVVDALCVLAQAAYEDYSDWVSMDRTDVTPPLNPGDYQTVAGIATNYVSLL